MAWLFAGDSAWPCPGFQHEQTALSLLLHLYQFVCMFSTPKSKGLVLGFSPGTEPLAYTWICRHI